MAGKSLLLASSGRRNVNTSSIRRIPRAININAKSLPVSAAQQTSATSILMPPPKLTRRNVQQAQRAAKRTASQQALLNKYNQAIGRGETTLATNQLQTVDYTGILPTGPTDASQYMAANLPTLPGITRAALRRESRKIKQMDKAVNRLNKFNAMRNKQGASLALGLDTPVDYSNVQPGGQAGAIGSGDPSQAPTQMEQQSAIYPQFQPQQQYQQSGGGYPGPMQMPQNILPSTGYEPYTPPMASQSPMSPIWASELAGGYVDPSLTEYDYQPSGSEWQDSLPFDLPNMSPEGDLLYLEPNESGEEYTMNDRFADFAAPTDDFEPLDSFAAYSADPQMSNFWSGITSLAQTGGQAYTGVRTAGTTARANALAEQRARAQAQREAELRARNKTNPAMIVGIVVAVGVLAFLASRSK